MSVKAILITAGIAVATGLALNFIAGLNIPGVSAIAAKAT